MPATQLVVLAFGPGSPYFAEAMSDPAGFLERRGEAMRRVAATRLHEQRWLPLARGSPWGLVLPAEGVDESVRETVASVRESYGDTLAELLERNIVENRTAVLIWQVVNCVVKGQG